MHNHFHGRTETEMTRRKQKSLLLQVREDRNRVEDLLSAWRTGGMQGEHFLRELEEAAGMLSCTWRALRRHMIHGTGLQSRLIFGFSELEKDVMRLLQEAAQVSRIVDRR